jgi:hypothetical protein
MILSPNPFNIPSVWNIRFTEVNNKKQRGLTVVIDCPTCNKEFTRFARDVKFRKSKGSLMFCSRSCSAKHYTPTRRHVTTSQIQSIKIMRKSGRSSYRIAEDTGLARNTVMKYW